MTDATKATILRILDKVKGSASDYKGQELEDFLDRALAEIVTEIEKEDYWRSEFRDFIVGMIHRSPRDWSLDYRDACLYGVVIGWGHAWFDVAKRHQWDGHYVDQMKRINKAFKKEEPCPPSAPEN